MTFPPWNELKPVREKRLKVETVKKNHRSGNILVLVCQYCLDLLYSLYPSTIVNSETSPLFQLDNASETPKRPKGGVTGHYWQHRPRGW